MQNIEVAFKTRIFCPKTINSQQNVANVHGARAAHTLRARCAHLRTSRAHRQRSGRGTGTSGRTRSEKQSARRYKEGGTTNGAKNDMKESRKKEREWKRRKRGEVCHSVEFCGRIVDVRVDVVWTLCVRIVDATWMQCGCNVDEQSMVFFKGVDACGRCVDAVCTHCGRNVDAMWMQRGCNVDEQSMVLFKGVDACGRVWMHCGRSKVKEHLAKLTFGRMWTHVDALWTPSPRNQSNVWTHVDVCGCIVDVQKPRNGNFVSV